MLGVGSFRRPATERYMNQQKVARRGWFRSLWRWLDGAPRQPKKGKPSRFRPLLEALEDRTLLAVSVTFPDLPSWQEIGPAPLLGGQAKLPGNNPVSGAIQAVVAAPSNPSIVYVGAASGGIWRTDNINAAGGP